MSANAWRRLWYRCALDLAWRCTAFMTAASDPQTEESTRVWMIGKAMHCARRAERALAKSDLALLRASPLRVAGGAA